VGESSFWYRPTRVVPDQRPLNGRCCCCCCSADTSLALAVSLTHRSPSDHFPVFTKLSINPAPLPPPTLHFFLWFHSINVGSFLHPTYIRLGRCWLCGKSSSTSLPAGGVLPPEDDTQQRSGKKSRSQRADQKVCFESCTRARSLHDAHSTP